MKSSLQKRSTGMLLAAAIAVTALFSPAIRATVSAGAPNRLRTASMESKEASSAGFEPVRYESSASAVSTWQKSRQQSYNFDASSGAGSAETRQLKNLSAAAKKLPMTYDLRNVNGVCYSTSVKNQQKWNTCWAFAADGSIESNLLMKSGGQTAGNDRYDLSELQASWFTLQPVTENVSPSQMGEGQYLVAESGRVLTSPEDDTAILSNGGFEYNVTDLYSSWQGAQTEKELPYQNTDGYSATSNGDWSLENSDRTEAAVHLQSAEYLPVPAVLDGNGNYSFDENAAAAIKKAVYENGAVMIGYAADTTKDASGTVGTYFNYKTAAQYTNKYVEANHGVTIVGWDDHFAKENFKNGTVDSAPADGAWIVKNEWGAGTWGLFEKDSVSYVFKVKDGDYAGNFVHKQSDGSRIITDSIAEGGHTLLTGAVLKVLDDGTILLNTAGGKYICVVEPIRKAGYEDSPTWSGYFYLSYYDQTLSSATSFGAVEKGSSADYDHNYQYDYLGSSTFCGTSSSAKKVSLANVFTSGGYQSLSAVSAMTSAPSSTVNIKIYTFGVGQKVTNPTAGKLAGEKTVTLDYAGFHTVNLGFSVKLHPNEPFAVVETDSYSKNGKTYYYAPIEKGTASIKDRSGCYVHTEAIANTGESFVGTDENWYDVSNRTAIKAMSKIDPTAYEVTYYDNSANGSFTIDSVGNAMIKAFTRDCLPGASELLSAERITLAQSLTYTGSAQKPPVVVKNAAGAVLELNTDYSLVYSDNIKTGKAMVTVTGKNDYSGTVTKTFWIIPAKVTGNSAKATGGGTVKAAWSLSANASAGVTGYQVWYKIAGKSAAIVTVSSAKAVSKNLNLKKDKGKNVTVAVRAYKTVGKTVLCGAWSSLKTVRIK